MLFIKLMFFATVFAISGTFFMNLSSEVFHKDAWKRQMIPFTMRDVLLIAILGALTYWTLESIVDLMPAWYAVVGFVSAILVWFVFATGDTDGISLRNLVGLPFLFLFGWMGLLASTAAIIAYEFLPKIRWMFHPVE